MAMKWFAASSGVRQGYYFVPRGKMLVGPFKTVEEAKEALEKEPVDESPDPQEPFGRAP